MTDRPQLISFVLNLSTATTLRAALEPPAGRAATKTMRSQVSDMGGNVANQRKGKMAAATARDIRALLGFRIAQLATITDRKAQSQISTRFDMNLSEWRVLGSIHAVGPLTLTELARNLYQDKGQLSRTVSALTGRKLVAGKRAANGGPHVFLSLTAEGRRWHDRIFDFVAARNQHLLDALAPKERGEVFRLLDKLTAAANTAYVEALAQAAPATDPPRDKRRVNEGARG
ncbi:MAG: MarR family winged helix-turn-helix transcriptional regulator [Pseudomonadota bacterium]